MAGLWEIIINQSINPYLAACHSLHVNEIGAVQKRREEKHKSILFLLWNATVATITAVSIANLPKPSLTIDR